MTNLGDPPGCRVRLRNRDVWLPPGTYVIGRGGGCHVVVDDRKVSRRHAQLSVRAGLATIRDLGSANGVFVDGQRAEAETPLREGSRIVVGGEVLEISFGVQQSPREQLPTLPGRTSNVPAAHEDEDEPTVRALPDAPGGPGMAAVNAGAATQRADALEMFGDYALEAIRGGRAADAERLVEVHLRSFLSVARAGTIPRRESLERAVTLALELAIAGRGGWFDFAVDLFDAIHVPPASLEIVERMERAARAGAVDVEKLTRWTRTLRHRIASFDVQDLERIDRIEALLAAVVRGRR